MSKRRLLLADDSPTIQKVVNLTFADEGIDVISVSDGNAAIESISETPPDIVLADVHMPGLNGYEVCDRIRHNESTKDLPVVLLVGSFEPFDDGEAARVGANAHLTKPFQSIRALVDQVSQLIDESAGAPADEPKPEGGEPETEAASHGSGPDTSDIDNLYTASFAETIEIPADEDLPADYLDAGMDDEIIETSYVGNREQSVQSDADPLQIFADGTAAEEPERAPSGEAENHETELSVVEEKAAGASSPFSEIAETESASRAPLPSAAEQNGPSVSTDAGRSENRPFEDLELLELPPTETADMLEFTTEQRAAESGSKTRVVSISPELMAVIVQKVVDRLSEKG